MNNLLWICLVTLCGCAGHMLYVPSSQSSSPPIQRQEIKRDYLARVVHRDSRKVWLRIDNARIVVAFPQKYEFLLPREQLVQWIIRNASAVAEYYGGLPVDRLSIFIEMNSGRGTGYSTVAGFQGAVIKARVGRYTLQEDLDSDWVMCHEMSHLGFPSVPRQHRWIEEGLATYLESVIRGRAGMISREQAWRELFEGLPNGQPQIGDRGLDYTPTWGRVYWGGAMYWFLADIKIRQHSQGKDGLEQALRGIISSGGNITSFWKLRRTLQMGDRAIKAPILTELYDNMREAPMEINLDELWKQLGIDVGTWQKTVFFSDNAPMSEIRDAIIPPSK